MAASLQVRRKAGPRGSERSGGSDIFSYRKGQRLSHVSKVGWGGRRGDTLMSEGPCPRDPRSDQAKVLRPLVSSMQQTSECTMLRHPLPPNSRVLWARVTLWQGLQLCLTLVCGDPWNQDLVLSSRLEMPQSRTPTCFQEAPQRS